jgi:hypothetical protein
LTEFNVDPNKGEEIHLFLFFDIFIIKKSMSNKFILSERERNRILNLHNQRILMEREGEQTPPPTPAASQPAPNPQTPPPTPAASQPAPNPQTPPPTPAASQTVQQPTKLAGRWDTASCEGKTSRCDVKGLKKQMRINDLCTPDVLNAVLVNYSKGRVGEPGSYKLKEDGDFGTVSTKAGEACMTSIQAKISQGQSQQPSSTGPTGPQPIPVGGNLTANDIKELIS